MMKKCVTRTDGTSNGLLSGLQSQDRGGEADNDVDGNGATLSKTLVRSFPWKEPK